ncbi:E3 ubiquitin-protein ligase sina-like [Anabrus simplex]|uniref:E3 ubiquitin-protein ligase sina-like n=1 Tax=Anabrus simplex TaxID=316456 RepID=UPI0035A35785
MSSNSSLKVNSKDEDQITGSAESQPSVDLLKSLECPVCFKYMTSTIHNCVSGHSICSSCKKKGVSTCPVCRAGLSSGRNYVAEEMAKHILFPCENKDRDCTVRVLGSEVEQHQLNCPRRFYKCPMVCTWTGGRDQLTKHYTDQHAGYILNSGVGDWTWQGSFLAVKYYYLMCVQKELFFWFVSVNPNKRYLTSCVHYIGDAEEATMFTYTATLMSKDGRRSLCYTDVAKNDSSDLDPTKLSTELFFANEDTYKNFADKDGKVSLTIKVSKVSKNIKKRRL